jgi:hypothetical protein
MLNYGAPSEARTVSGDSTAGLQEGGPVGERAVPTELRWKTTRSSPPSAVVTCRARAGWSAAIHSRGGLTRGNPSVVSSNDKRDNMPSVSGWSGRSPVAGCCPRAASCVTSASTEAAGTVARSTGKEGRAKGAIARRAANQAAGQQRSCQARCPPHPHKHQSSPAPQTDPRWVTAALGNVEH